MTMEPRLLDNLTFIFVIAAIWIIVAIVIIGTTIVYGENFTYEMTENETKELFVSQMCLAGVDINVTGLPECKNLVGSIDTNYGEALK